MKKVIIYVKPNNGFASATEVNEIDMRVYADTLPGVIVLNVGVNLSEESINEYVSFIAKMNGLAKSKGIEFRVVNEVADIAPCKNIYKLINELKKLGIKVGCKEAKAIKRKIKERNERADKANDEYRAKHIERLEHIWF